MRRLDIAVAVWGAPYVDTMLRIAIPSFMAPGNLPSCAAVADIHFSIVTRPEDEGSIRTHAVVASLSKICKLKIEPLLTPDNFRNVNRYDVMAFCHRHVIAQSLADRSIISILSPDCIVADGSLRYCLDRILEGKRAVLIAGPRATLEDVGPELARTYQQGPHDAPIAIPARSLVKLLTSFPHAISRLLFWDAPKFSQFPSAVYWRAGSDSFIARYFHLHPLFVDLAHASDRAQQSGTVDGTLLSMAAIGEPHVFVVEDSDDACVVELSRRDHDPMGSLPIEVEDRAAFVVDWARTYADKTHRAQFARKMLRFRGEQPVDWDLAISASRHEVERIGEGLERLEQVVKVQTLLMRINRVLTPGPTWRLIRWFWIPVAVLHDLLVRRARRLKLLFRYIWDHWGPPSNTALSLQHHYSVEVVPHRAQRAGLFSKLAHALLRRLRVVFVVNVSTGMGHNTVELDRFLRLKKHGKLDAHARYVLVRLPDQFTIQTAELYGHHFAFVSTRALLGNLCAPLTARYPDIRLDCGLSRLKWQLRPDGAYDPPPPGQSFLYQTTKAENHKAWLAYYRLRDETRDLHPLRDGLSPDRELLAFLGGSTERIALFHLKFHVVNATAAPSEPASYLPAMRWLKSQGYRLVMIGREQMPAEFEGLSVLNYAESSLTSYRHDLQLVALADLVVTAGSGIALMPDCMGRPLVYLDSWHLGMPMASERCVMVPALMKERATGRLLTFSEQMSIYLAMEDQGDEVFPSEHYEARNAAPDEVLEAVREALTLANATVEFSTLQSAFRALDGQGLMAHSRARVSEYFLRRHVDLLAPGHAAAKIASA